MSTPLPLLTFDLVSEIKYPTKTNDSRVRTDVFTQDTVSLHEQPGEASSNVPPISLSLCTCLHMRTHTHTCTLHMCTCVHTQGMCGHGCDPATDTLTWPRTGLHHQPGSPCPAAGGHSSVLLCPLPGCFSGFPFFTGHRLTFLDADSQLSTNALIIKVTHDISCGLNYLSGPPQSRVTRWLAFREPTPFLFLFKDFTFI